MMTPRSQRPSRPDSQATASPATIRPPSSTRAHAPPPQPTRIAACNPGSASSIRSHGRVSPPIQTTAGPRRRRRPLDAWRSIPDTSRLARRTLGSASEPSSAISSDHRSKAMIVTCRRPPWFALPERPRPATNVASPTGSIGPRYARFVQIRSIRPIRDIVAHPDRAGSEVSRLAENQGGALGPAHRLSVTHHGDAWVPGASLRLSGGR